jgi:hypothetical protein
VTAALCLKCGATKFGAFGTCPNCGSGSTGDLALDMMFTSHFYSAATLRQFGAVIAEIRKHCDDPDRCLMAFALLCTLDYPEVLTTEFDPAISDSLELLLLECTLPTVVVERTL